MTVKVFISYSHKYESHKEDLEEHLSLLKRNGVILDWNDRKIVPGQNWSNEISENLESSTLIVFLVSSSFLSSEYCSNIEAKRAIQMHNQGLAQLIPIVVRPCSFSDSELSIFQALPKNAEPITKWENLDEAWLNVVEGIKLSLKEFKPIEEKGVSSDDKDKNISLTEGIARWLEDTEIVLTHRKVDKVLLSDIYVSADIKIESIKNNKDIEIVDTKTIVDSNNKYLISGEEQQGKTTLLKNMFKHYASESQYVLYLDAADVSKSDVEYEIKTAIRKQYKNLTFEGFLSGVNNVLLLDNLDRINLNSKYRESFLNKIDGYFYKIFITCHDSFKYVVSDITYLDDFILGELKGFGNLKREEIAKKWISLGREESIEDSELYSKCDEIKARLDTVIKKNIVPPKPIYVLTIMQMFEAYAQQNIELTSYGHCYQQLIYQALEKANVKHTEYEKYLNVLTELSWSIYKNGKGLNEFQIEEFFLGYEEKYLSVDKVDIIRKLCENSVLSRKDFRLDFRYPYIYYFFVAKKIAESFNESQSVKEDVKEILSTLHREDCANILIFITHHSRDSWVIEEIKDVLSSLFSDQNQATLKKEQLSFMDDFINQIPDLVLERREISSERENHNRRLDEIENNEDESDYEPIDILANINKTFKGMEISGQIIRNRHATLTRNSLVDLAKNASATGLRFLDYFINLTDSSRSEIIKVVEAKLAEHPNLTNLEVQEHAKKMYLHLIYGVINGVIRKIASSIGSKEASEIYSMLDEEDTPAYSLLKQSIDLQFTRSLMFSDVEKTYKKLKNNPVCLRILKEMVVQHIYMFPVDYRTKQRLSELLGITVQGQRILDQKRVGKG